MTLPNPTVTAWLGLPYDSGDFFTLGHPTKGQLNGAYGLAGDVGTDLSSYAFDISVARGRSRELDEFEAGTCSIQFRNLDRAFDPLYIEYLYDEDGEIITDEDDDPLITDGSPLAGGLVPGKRVTVAIYGQVIFDGTIEDWNVTYSTDGDSTASLLATDALGSLARRQFNEWTATAAQTAGERITDVLNRSEVAFPYSRDVGTGISTLQGDLVTWGSEVLNYLQLVAKSDQGALFASRNNTLTFRDRHSTISAVATLSFADTGAADTTPFSAIDVAIGADLLFNRASVDREGGTAQTSTDAASMAAYGARSLSLGGLLLDSDDQSLSMSEFLLARYKDPTERLTGLTVNFASLADLQQAAAAAADLGDVVSVEVTPRGVGLPTEMTLTVEGVRHAISHTGYHVMSLSLSPIAQSAVFILDDPVLGQLDHGGVLAF
jgi:hypothetical protein